MLEILKFRVYQHCVTLCIHCETLWFLLFFIIFAQSKNNNTMKKILHLLVLIPLLFLGGCDQFELDWDWIIFVKN